MLRVVGSDLICDIDRVLAVEEDENFPDPLQYLKDEVWHMLLGHSPIFYHILLYITGL